MRAEGLGPGSEIRVCLGIKAVRSDPYVTDQSFVKPWIDVLVVLEVSSECYSQNVGCRMRSKSCASECIVIWGGLDQKSNRVH